VITDIGAILRTPSAGEVEFVVIGGVAGTIHGSARGTFDLDDHLVRREAFGVTVRCVDLPTLIHLKRAAGRAKDLEAIAELEKLRIERGDRA
jgi:hypothetical protein